MINHDQLILQLDEQYQNVCTLKNIIKDENHALIHSHSDLLLTLSEKKINILNEINRLNNIMNNNDINTLARTHTELTKKINQIKILMQECHDLNNANATLIEFNLARLNRFAQALQQCRNAHSLTYDEKGNTSTISTLGNNIKA